jgi:hypothetical protein
MLSPLAFRAKIVFEAGAVKNKLVDESGWFGDAARWPS